ncbi:MAG: ComEA family DNA-binding protein [Chloroflexi bacterium]|nr:ComEA family DNA-binding protein [Chloroflexota bacterium]
MRNAVQAALFLALLATLGGGLFALLDRPSAGRVEILLPTPSPTPTIEVYVSGAVQSPGVYRVGPGDRLENVLRMAGGATQDADLDRINLSLRVADQAHFHVPRVGEALPTLSPASAKVNINTASAEELQALHGIGEVKARAIVEYREANGPFLRVEDLLLVPGIGTTTLEDLQDLITVR